MRLARAAVLVGAIVLLALALPASEAHAARPAALPLSLVPRGPIDIEGDANFTAVNGVVSGTGTAADPYVIAGWVITAPPSIGVQLRATSAHVVLRDLRVTLAPVAGFYFFGVSNVTLTNVTAFGNSGEGVRFESSERFVLGASAVGSNAAGVVVLDSTNGTVQANNVTLNTGDGIVLTNSPSISVEANNISLNGFLNSGYGIHLASTTNDTVSGNHFFRNGIFLDGAAAEHFDSHTISADNLVSGLPILYEAKCNGLGLSHLTLGGILIASCRHLRLSNVSISGGDASVEIAFASNVTLGPNLTISDSASGVVVYRSDTIQCLDGVILDIGMGMDLESSTNVLVSGLKISSPSSATLPLNGIAVRGSDTVNVTATILRHFGNGVETENSGNVSLVGNVVDLNTVGFNAYRSHDLVLLGNLFVQDGSGIRLLSVANATLAGNEILGALVDGANVSASTGVRAVHNTFSGSAQDAFDGLPAANAWDGGYPAGGNYWGTYRGVDLYQGPSQNLAGSDGIGDTPYVFPMNASDRYPLMVRPVAVDVPPEALFSVTPPAGNVRTVFIVSANLSSDYEDPLAALQVRWAWDDGAAFGAWTATKFASHLYAVPGFHTIHLEVLDTAGRTDTWSGTVRVAPKPDNLPPVITSTPVTTADVGQPIVVRANLSDPSGIFNATLLYRGVGDAGFTGIPMGYVNGTNFSATIPGQPRAGSVEYVIVANDSWGNEARSPLTGAVTVTILDPVLTALLVWVLPAVLGAVVIAAAVVVLRRRRRSAPPPEESAPPPGNP